ncbi:unnamed protein product [Gongylonema pulchrum]|uniref:INCENP_ARK-bind domain-containing protein n=1 Tax=Gongylonema pulchrum TaxID=637853 RepID=A0A183CXD5_9BILA|nr:unnamed protein product [Gongylonema pulchrum]
MDSPSSRQRRKAFAKLHLFKFGKATAGKPQEEPLERDKHGLRTSEISGESVCGQESNALKDFTNELKSTVSETVVKSFSNRGSRKKRRNLDSRTFGSRQPFRNISSCGSSFRRNSVKALKNAYHPPGGLEMILASVDESFNLHSNLIRTNDSCSRDSDNSKNPEPGIESGGNKIDSVNFGDNARLRTDIPKTDGNFSTEKVAENVRGPSDKTNKTLVQPKPSFSGKIDLKEDEIVQWLGGLPIINPEKMLSYFCGKMDPKMSKLRNRQEPYTIFSLAKPDERVEDWTSVKELQKELYGT